jgi:hypothetical protein
MPRELELKLELSKSDVQRLGSELAVGGSYRDQEAANCLLRYA